MEDKIIQFLIEADAVSSETGKTFRDVMETLGLNEATLRSNLNRLVGGRISASPNDLSVLRTDAAMEYEHINPIELRPKGRNWTRHHEVVVWLGPSEMNKLRQEKQQEDLMNTLKIVAEKPSISIINNSGIASVGDGNAIAQSASAPAAAQLGSDARIQQGAEPDSWTKQIVIGVFITVIGGLIVWGFTSG